MKGCSQGFAGCTRNNRIWRDGGIGRR